MKLSNVHETRHLQTPAGNNDDNNHSHNGKSNSNGTSNKNKNKHKNNNNNNNLERCILLLCPRSLSQRY